MNDHTDKTTEIDNTDSAPTPSEPKRGRRDFFRGAAGGSRLVAIGALAGGLGILLIGVSSLHRSFDDNDGPRGKDRAGMRGGPFGGRGGGSEMGGGMGGPGGRRGFGGPGMRGGGEFSKEDMQDRMKQREEFLQYLKDKESADAKADSTADNSSSKSSTTKSK